MAKIVMVYKGYTGEAQRTIEGGFEGTVLDAPEETGIQGATLEELQSSFTQAVLALHSAAQGSTPP